jgi:hypothetical protein
MNAIFRIFLGLCLLAIAEVANADTGHEQCKAEVGAWMRAVAPKLPAVDIDKTLVNPETCTQLLVRVRASISARAEPWRPSWRVDRMKDPMTGFDNVVWTIEATNEVSGTLGRSVRPTLALRCHRNKTEVLIEWRQFVTTSRFDGSGHHVMVRIGEQKASTSGWSMSTNYEATFSRNAVALLKSLKGQTRFLAETIPHGSSAVTAAFDIQGVDKAIDEVAGRCGWR